MDALSIMRAVAALAIVLGLIGALYWGARRFSNLRPSSPLSEDLKVVAWKPFDGRKRLAVVRWGDQEHLILTSQAQDLHIASRKASDDDTPESSDEA